MTDIQFNPGHLEAIRKFLQPGKDTISPAELAEQAKDASLVEQILDILQQELGNTALVADFFFMLVEDIETASIQVTDENAEKLADLLANFISITYKATQNAQLIIDCLSRIQQIEEATKASGQPSLFTEKSYEHVEKLNRSNQIISQAFSGKLEEYNRKYEAGLAKLNEYLDKED